MSDDEADPELLDLLRKSLGIEPKPTGITSETNVLRDAEYIYSNSIDVAIDRASTVSAAHSIWAEMQKRSYSTAAWSEHELHPKTKDEATVNFIFTMDLLNFSFWSELPEDQRYSVTFKDKRWTGYWSLVACLQRAIEEGIPITSPQFWLEAASTAETPDEQDEAQITGANPSEGGDGDMSVDATADVAPEEHPQPGSSDEMSDVEASTQINAAANFDDRLNPTDEVDTAPLAADKQPRLTEDVLKHVFRGDGDEGIPLLIERLSILRESGRVLHECFDSSVVQLVERADGSAGRLVNLLAHHFDCFRDEARFDGKRVRFLKRAQIFVADLWAAFDGTGYGQFDDIDCITMFADYRVPQQLHSLGCFAFSPSLDYVIRTKQTIPSGSKWECQLRGCSIWVVELIRRSILAEHPDAKVNAILIDFFLYDLAKEREKVGEQSIPHHRTRSIWY